MHLVIKTWKKWKNGEVLIWISDLPKYLIFQPFLWILWNIHFLVKIDSDKLQKKLELILFGKKVRNIPSDRSKESGYVHYRYFTAEKTFPNWEVLCVITTIFPERHARPFSLRLLWGKQRDAGLGGKGGKESQFWNNKNKFVLNSGQGLCHVILTVSWAIHF